MAEIPVTLAPEKTGGAIRNILGMCNSPTIRNVGRTETDKRLFKKLHPARVRHHDAVNENPGYEIVDVTRIFPLFHADENDPANYVFAPTDFYFQQIVDCGIPIELKFGERIEKGGQKFKVLPPSDPKKWAKICVNILRHYNEGWADGMRLGIRYVSIWEEPDNQALFVGPFEQYLELYRETALALRRAFPEVKICGPNTMELKKLESHAVSMSGTFVTMSATTAKKLAAVADIDSDDSTHIVPRNDLLMKDFETLWWIGD